MFNQNLSHFVLSALGALLLSGTIVSAAVGPAHMVEAPSVGYAAAAPQVEGGVDA